MAFTPELFEKCVQLAYLYSLWIKLQNLLASLTFVFGAKRLPIVQFRTNSNILSPLLLSNQDSNFLSICHLLFLFYHLKILTFD